MNILLVLVPVSLVLGLGALVVFAWNLKNRQYDDPEGDGQRILSGEWDDAPKP